MNRILQALVFSTALVSAHQALAGDPASCVNIKMSDLGWTDIMTTNTSAQLVLEALGYKPTQTLLALDVTYMSLQNKDMDIFLGAWRPAQTEQYKGFFTDGRVAELGVNLTGAKFTLAVPKYVSDAGVKSFDDLAAHADQFGKSIYAIEPGSNQPLIDMVAANRHGLKDWQIVETSEAGMLTQVKRAVNGKEWIAFLGWEPHPMNLDYQMTYLSGGDIEYGPDYGGSTVYTLARGGFAAECPNAAKFFSQLKFDLTFENLTMKKIMGEGMAVPDAVKVMLPTRPDLVEAWLKDVTTIDGKPALPVVKAALGM